MKKKIVIALFLTMMIAVFAAVTASAYDTNVIYYEDFDGVVATDFTSEKKGNIYVSASGQSGSFDIVDNALVLTHNETSGYPSVAIDGTASAYASNHFVFRYRFKMNHDIVATPASNPQICRIASPRLSPNDVMQANVYADGKVIVVAGTTKDTFTTIQNNTWYDVVLEIDGTTNKLNFTMNGVTKTYDIPEAVRTGLTNKSLKFIMAQIWPVKASVSIDDACLAYALTEDTTPNVAINVNGDVIYGEDFASLKKSDFASNVTFLKSGNVYISLPKANTFYEFKNGKLRCSAGKGEYPIAAFDGFGSNFNVNRYIWNYRIKLDYVASPTANVMRIANLRLAGKDIFRADVAKDGKITATAYDFTEQKDVSVSLKNEVVFTKGEYHDVSVEVINKENKLVFSLDGTVVAECTIDPSKAAGSGLRFVMFQLWGHQETVTLDNAVIYCPYAADEEPNEEISVDGEIIASEDFKSAAKGSFVTSGTYETLGKLYTNVSDQAAEFDIKNERFVLTSTGTKYPSVVFDGMAQNYKYNHYVLSYKIRIDHGAMKDGAEVVRIASPRVDGKDVFYAEVDCNGNLTVMRDKTLGTVATLEQGKYYAITLEIDGEGRTSKLSIDGTEVAQYPIADDVIGLLTKKSLKFIMAQVWGVKARITVDNAVVYYPNENREIKLFPKGETIFSENFNKLKTSKFTKNTEGTFDCYKNFYTNAVEQKSKFSVKNGVFTMTATKTGGFPCFTFDGKTEDYKSNRYILSYKFKLDHNITEKGKQIARIANPRVGGKDVFYAEVDSDGNVTVMRDKSLGVVATIPKGEYCAIGVAVDGKKGVTKFYINGHLIVEYPIPDDVKGLLTNKSLKFNMCQLWSVPAVASIDAGMVTYGTTYVVQIGDYYYVNGVRCETAPPTGTPAAYALTFAACAACGIAVLTKKKKKH